MEATCRQESSYDRSTHSFAHSIRQEIFRYGPLFTTRNANYNIPLQLFLAQMIFKAKINPPKAVAT